MKSKRMICFITKVIYSHFFGGCIATINVPKITSMPRTQKKRITEREKLVFNNPSGGKFQKSKGKREKKDAANLHVVEETTPPVPPTSRYIALAAETCCCVDDDNSVNSKDDFFFDIDDLSIECDEPDADGGENVDDNNVDNDNVMEASPHEVFASEVVVESMIAKNAATDRSNKMNLPNLLEYACEDLPDFMFVHEGGDETNSNDLGDTPIVLLGDDSLVCLPCATEDCTEVTGSHDSTSSSQGIHMEIGKEEMQRICEDEKRKNVRRRKQSGSFGNLLLAMVLSTKQS